MAIPTRMQADGKTLELLMYGEIGLGDLTAERIAKTLDSAEDVERIVLRVSSPGGDAFEGLTIHNMLSRHAAKVTAFIDGQASSAASLVVQAADERVIAANAIMMVHEARGGIGGTAAEHESDAAALRNLNASARSIYAGKSKLNDDELAELMATDSWMGAEKALAAGLVDRIDDARDMAAVVSRFAQRRPAASRPAKGDRAGRFVAAARDALVRALDRTDDSTTRDDIMSIIWEEMDSQTLRDTVEEVLEETGMATTPDNPEASAKLMPEDEEHPPAAQDEDDKDMQDEVDATSVVERLSEAVGLDAAGTLALLVDKLDEVAAILNTAADADGTEAESQAVEDEQMSARARLQMNVLNRKLARQSEEIRALQADRQRERDAELDAEVRALVSDGTIGDDEVADTKRWFKSDPEGARRFFSRPERKHVPIGRSQAGSETRLPEGQSPSKIEHLSGDARNFAQRLMKTGIFDEARAVKRALQQHGAN